MARPRKDFVYLDTTPYYHCVSRCVRKAYLCGSNQSGRSYEHRRGWIEKKCLKLASLFSIDICAYAVMHNHYHLVLHVNKTKCDSWSDKEVIERWHQLFKGNHISQQFMKGEILSEAEKALLSILATTWRNRLMDISWFMRIVNEGIARQANREDECSGRFWEGRYKMQALLDEKALAACMAYVDLNPVRAKIAKTPENSEYTSAKKRADYIKNYSDLKNVKSQNKSSSGLFPFLSGINQEEKTDGLPFHQEDYLALLDWTGRAISAGKRGVIPADYPPILDRLQIDARSWMLMSNHFESRFRRFAGSIEQIQKVSEQLKQQWVHGMTAGRLLSKPA